MCPSIVRTIPKAVKLVRHRPKPERPEKLSNAKVEALPAREKDYYVSDPTVAGLVVKVTPTGRKVYILRYRNAYAQQRKLTIGAVGEIPLIHAQRLAQEAWQAIRAGRDPQDDKEGQRNAVTLSEFSERYLSDYVGMHLKPNSVKEYTSSVRTIIQPRLGRKALKAVQRSDIIDLHLSLKSTPYRANRVIAVIKAMFNKAEEWGVLPFGSNPALRIKTFKEQAKQRIFDADEQRRIGAAIEELRPLHPASGVGFDAIVFLFLTGLRVSEALALRWEEIDLNKSTAQLKDSKTGARRTILSKEATAFLSGFAWRDRLPWVFPGKYSDQALTGIKRPWAMVCAQAGIEDARIHDIRHTVATYIAATGTLQSAQAVLGHASSKTTERYAHPMEQTVREHLGRATAEISVNLARKQNHGEKTQIVV